jgi:NADPH-dependent ferric siderophore reductase
VRESETYEPRYHAASVCQVTRSELITPRVKRITLHDPTLEGLGGHWYPEMLLRLYFSPRVKATPQNPISPRQENWNSGRHPKMRLAPSEHFRRIL